jgi:DHA1 family bicyclomycin/chloramphenicol resistance-like MFS transporter
MQDISKQEFIVFTASAMVLLALGIDIMLPAFAEVRKHYGLSPNSILTSNIVAFFFMGQITQIFFGYLTDKLGRIPIIRTGIIIYIISGIAAVYAPVIELMFLFRFLAGVGAAAVVMTAIASVRDRYVGDDMAKIMSFVFTIFLIIPVVAPALGTWILEISSWRTVFLVPPYFAIVVFIWTFRIPESHTKEKRTTLSFIATMKGLGEVLSNKTFMKFTIIATLLFSILSSWVASSERIIGEIFQKPHLFTLVFGTAGSIMALFAFLNAYLTKKIGAKKSLRIFLTSYLIVAFTLTVFTLWYDLHPPFMLFFLSIVFLMGLTAGGDPNSSALALEPMGDKAGLAASVYGTIFFFMGSCLGSVISGQMISDASSLAIGSLIVSGIAFILFHSVHTNSVNK